MSTSEFKVFLIEDDSALREAISVTLQLGRVEFEAFEAAEDALEELDTQTPQLIVTDFRLPGMNGIELIGRVHAKYPQLPVVVMTAYADTQLAVKALKAGARDFLIKPFVPEQLLEVIEHQKPVPQAAKDADGSAIIAVDSATLAVMQRCERVAPTDATVLLTGESGAGKDVFARHIHLRSQRKDEPYVAINCAAIPDNLLEATLFGYEKGAFTGATKSQPGKFEQADGGTLFLDEIGEMPPELQAKLLRVLQDQVVERLGSVKSVNCNVRIVAATNQDLQARVKDGRFREDLYFRLAVFPVRVPPLRERPQDILPLARHFLQRYGRTMGRQLNQFTDAAQNMLELYGWPGNVRELENTIQRALLLCDGPRIDSNDIELHESVALTPSVAAPVSESGTKLASLPASVPEMTVELRDIESVEREHILKVLKQVGGNRKEAVAVLGLSERALRYKLKAYKEAGFLSESE